jgi:hypothetical protein
LGINDYCHKFIILADHSKAGALPPSGFPSRSLGTRKARTDFAEFLQEPLLLTISVAFMQIIFKKLKTQNQ